MVGQDRLPLGIRGMLNGSAPRLAHHPRSSRACGQYQHWHRWVHEDPLLYRTVHKFHHLFRRPTPLVSSTETHMEWCLSWAGAHTFCNPFYQFNLFMYDAVDATELHSHDVLSSKKIIGGPTGYHPLHHKHALCNFSVPDWDQYYGTMTTEKAFDNYFPHRTTTQKAQES